MDAERRQVFGQSGRGARILWLELADQLAQPGLAVSRRAGQVERCPESITDAGVEILALGQLGEAKAEAAEVLRIEPGFTIERWKCTVPYKNPADAEHLFDGLRKAGLPE